MKKQNLYKTALLKGCGVYVSLRDAVERADGWYYLCSTGFDGYGAVWHHESALDRFCL